MLDEVNVAENESQQKVKFGSFPKKKNDNQISTVDKNLERVAGNDPVYYSLEDCRVSINTSPANYLVDKNGI